MRVCVCVRERERERERESCNLASNYPNMNTPEKKCFLTQAIILHSSNTPSAYNYMIKITHLPVLPFKLVHQYQQ